MAATLSLLEWLTKRRDKDECSDDRCSQDNTPMPSAATAQRLPTEFAWLKETKVAGHRPATDTRERNVIFRGERTKKWR
jgi:hypothetical protein